MFDLLNGSVKGFKKAIIVLRQAQDYRSLTFVMGLANPSRVILKHPLRSKIFIWSGNFAPYLLLVQSHLPIPFSQRLSLTAHDER